MSQIAALPFFLRRGEDVVGTDEITSTTETIHGLLRLEGEALVVQWRTAREIDRVGQEIRTDRELDPVRQVELPLQAVANATVRGLRWRWLSTARLVLTAADLQAFEEVAGAAGLRLEHPATIELMIQDRHRLLAQEFAADLNLARAEGALRAPEHRRSLTRGAGRLPRAQDGPFSLRALTADDVDLMEALLTVFGEAFEDMETYGADRPGAAYVERLLASDTFISIVALKGDVVVGGLAAYVLPKFERERSEVYIYDLAVAAEHRRQGIATALIHELERVAAARGAYVIFVQADHGDEPAIELYAGLGVREDVLHFDIPVTSQGVMS